MVMCGHGTCGTSVGVCTYYKSADLKFMHVGVCTYDTNMDVYLGVCTCDTSMAACECVHM